MTNSGNIQPSCLKFIQQWVSEDISDVEMSKYKLTVSVEEELGHVNEILDTYIYINFTIIWFCIFLFLLLEQCSQFYINIVSQRTKLI